MKTLKLGDFELFEIEKEYHENFKCATGNLSDFHANALLWIADVLKVSEKIAVIWCDNNAWWDTANGVRRSVFMTENGCAMLKNWTDGKLYRIIFK